MPLVDWEIRSAVACGMIKVIPYDDTKVNPDSLDVCLGGNFSTTIPTGSIINPLDKESFVTVPLTSEDHYVLKPGEFILASLKEDITLPPDICATIRGKSSLGRLGIDNSSVAGFIDGSWSGVLTIELKNNSAQCVQLTKGMRIGQIVFDHTEVPEKNYSQTGRYNRQEPGQGSLGV